jgi:hypothetical protein
MLLKPWPKPGAKMQPTGRRHNRRAPFYRQTEAELGQRVRARGGSCALCSRRGLGIQRHHVFGRAGTMGRLGWPWCDLPELSEGICPECHQAVTDMTITQGWTWADVVDLEWAAIGRFVDRGQDEGWLTPLVCERTRQQMHAKTEDPLDVIRLLVQLGSDRGGADIIVGGTAA